MFMKEFETIDLAFREFQREPSIKGLWYDDLKRKIVVEDPKHQNKILLLERGQEVSESAARAIMSEIARHHASQYLDDIQDKAKQNPITYDGLFTYLTEELHIFYDAAKYLEQWILNRPQEFGLEVMMHQEKSLCFIPIREH